MEWHVQLNWLNLKIETNIQKHFFVNPQQWISSVITNVKIIAKSKKYWRAIPTFKSVQKFYFAYNVLLQQHK